MKLIKSKGYHVAIGSDSFKSLRNFLKKRTYSSLFILCDENTCMHCLPVLIPSCPELASAHVIEIDSGETSKSLEFCAHIWQTLMENNADTNSLIINLGGGVISDLGGFTASVYKRGVDFVNIPTTLLAMADASIGGKTGIDFNNLKNAIGTYTQPQAVVVNPEFLKTLPVIHYRNGFAEIFKIALVADKKLWNILKSWEDLKNAGELIQRSIELKNKIVLKDPFDKGVRKVLNFGHTLGHALEVLLLETGNELHHGEAVYIGMMMESHIAFQKKMLTKAQLLEVITVLRSMFELRNITEVPVNYILELFKNYKKAAGDKIMCSLINSIGSCRVNIEVNERQIKKAMDFYNSLAR
jgi:3-dehydroquinate synthase